MKVTLPVLGVLFLTSCSSIDEDVQQSSRRSPVIYMDSATYGMGEINDGIPFLHDSMHTKKVTIEVSFMDSTETSG